ncbi:MAG: tail fiber domain-containing protein, partial [Pseudomonadota bacterium]|nr:tail fiber domain-containing protein [Pseudomonadota bacterium]
PGQADDFEPNTPETKIVGDLASDDKIITELSSSGLEASVTTTVDHGLTVDDQVLITGVGSTDLYNGTYRVTGITSDRKFRYQLNSDAIDNVVSDANLQGARVTIEADTVTGASPYIFNCSLRSVFGMCGLHADGSKATGFKSMVVAQFTGIGLQKDDNAFILYDSGTGRYNGKDSVTEPTELPLYINQKAVFKPAYENFHVKASNDAVIQAVSTFAIGFAAQFLSESGGEQSITNSNSN